MRIVRVGAAGVLMAGLMAPAAAQGVTKLYSYSGSDFSVNSTGALAIDACDREYDGNMVKAQWEEIYKYLQQETLNEGGSGTCERGLLEYVVYRHRIVEVIAFSRDDYGSWKYPT
jgi:hypothetical protein